jgi:hypothetical protein
VDRFHDLAIGLRHPSRTLGHKRLAALRTHLAILR